MSEMFASDDCPECTARNYYCCGDPSDIAGIDVEALTCWNCKHEWVLEHSLGITSLELAFTEEGMKNIE